MPLLEGLVTYSRMLKDRDIEEEKKNSAFESCQMREVGRSNCLCDSRRMKPTEDLKIERTSGHWNQTWTSVPPWKERLTRTMGVMRRNKIGD